MKRSISRTIALLAAGSTIGLAPAAAADQGNPDAADIGIPERTMSEAAKQESLRKYPADTAESVNNTQPTVSQTAQRSGAPTPSDATRGITDCGTDRLCIWSEIGFNGARGQFFGSNTDWSQFPQDYCYWSGNSGANWKDCASSVANRRYNSDAYLNYNIQGIGPQGGRVFMRGNSSPDLRPIGHDNDFAANYWS